jgi:sarcosine oxidase
MRVAVVGAGVVGLAASAALLDRGAEVTCFERAGAVMAERSLGSTRIFRLAHATPDLVALTATARDGYRRWERRAGRPMIGDTGCVVSGPKSVAWAAAMTDAGAPVRPAPDGPPLPARRRPAEALFDPSGGVIDVDAVRDHLSAAVGAAVRHEPVYALEADGSGAVVWVPSGPARFDAVLVAAGAGTSPLAAQVGVHTPPGLQHHVRFGFPLPADEAWPCWIDTPETGLGTYQHRSAPGTWAVGGHFGPGAVAWERGREAAATTCEVAVLGYAREHLTVEPTVVERVYCASTPDLGDGFTVRREGAVLAVHGDNLFKLAPVLGDVLAGACLDGSTPDPVGDHRR